MKNRRQKTLYIILVLFGILLLYQAAFGSFEYVPGSERVEYQYGGSDISSFSMYIAFALFVISGFKSYMNYGKKYGGLVFVLFILSAIMMSFFIYDMIEYGLHKQLAQSTGPIVFFILWGLFFSQNEDVWDSALKIARIIGPFLIIASVGVSVFFANVYGGHLGNSPQIMLLGNGFWPLAIGMLGNEKQDNSIMKVFFIFCVGCALTTALLYGTRSWAVQCFLLLGLYLFKESKGKIINIPTIVLATITGILVISLVENSFSENWDYLSGRMGDNTRSFQYEEIFSQFGFGDLFFGRGTFGTYRSSLYGQYMYIDNTMVYTWFHWGFIAMLCLIYILLYPFFKIILSNKASRYDKVRVTILLLWFLSLNGLSVYNTMTLDIRNTFIVILLGKEYLDCRRLQKNNYNIRNNGLETQNRAVNS